jgi:glycosyltransferase involved in cell wall biosynthesis
MSLPAALVLFITASFFGVTLSSDVPTTSPTYHLLGVAYSEANEFFSLCAFTMKLVRWCRLLNRMNASYVVYANANTSPHCRNVVEIFSTETRLAHYGPDVAWRSGRHSFDQRINSPGALEWQRLATREVKARMKRGDWILASFGNFHQPIAIATGLEALEIGVGYVQSFSKYRIFESHTWLANAMRDNDWLSLTDAVIPMCYWPDEFYVPFMSLRPVKRPYFAFVSRISDTKGINVALSMLCAMPDFDLQIAGVGPLETYLDAYSTCRDRVIFNGAIDANARNVLVKQATAVLSPSLYNEPFGSIVVESQFLGTPVISTDHAGMARTIWHGVTGFRCRTLRCFVAAGRAAAKLDRNRIIEFAKSNFACERLLPRISTFLDEVRDHALYGWHAAPLRNVTAMLAPDWTYTPASCTGPNCATTKRPPPQQQRTELRTEL